MSLRYAYVAVFVALVFSAALHAQPQRYELGRRLRAFETAWEGAPGDAARKRSAGPLNQAVTAFFTFRYGEAGRAIDQARFALAADAKITPVQRYAESLAIYPAKRLLDAQATELKVELKSFYETEKPDTKLTLQLRILKTGKPTVEITEAIGKLPQRFELPLKGPIAGDLVLHYAILDNQETLAKGAQTISLVDRLAARLAALAKIGSDDELASESASLKSTTRLLTGLMDGKTEETDYPAAQMLNECEEMVKTLQAKARFFTHERSGEKWISLVSKKPKQTFPMRVLIPTKWNVKSPPPLVVGLHGAGGSENMFFDGYGAGKIMKLCEKRGWMLVSPRVGFGFQLAPMLDELHARYAFDKKRVFVIGHSMGAAQAIQAVCADPRRYAGVVALGGSGVVKSSDDLKRVPMFVGVGNQDFALSGARGLKDRLSKAGVEKIVYRELVDVEHLGIVQQSLGEAFEFFDDVVLNASNPPHAPR